MVLIAMHVKAFRLMCTSCYAVCYIVLVLVEVMLFLLFLFHLLSTLPPFQEVLILRLHNNAVC